MRRFVSGFLTFLVCFFFAFVLKSADTATPTPGVQAYYAGDSLVGMGQLGDYSGRGNTLTAVGGPISNPSTPIPAQGDRSLGTGFNNPEGYFVAPSTIVPTYGAIIFYYYAKPYTTQPVQETILQVKGNIQSNNLTLFYDYAGKRIICSYNGSYATGKVIYGPGSCINVNAWNTVKVLYGSTGVTLTVNSINTFDSKPWSNSSLSSVTIGKGSVAYPNTSTNIIDAVFFTSYELDTFPPEIPTLTITPTNTPVLSETPTRTASQTRTISQSPTYTVVVDNVVKTFIEPNVEVSYDAKNFDPDSGKIYFGSTPETTPSSYPYSVSATNITGNTWQTVLDLLSASIGGSETAFMMIESDDSVNTITFYLDETFVVPSETPTFTPTITPAIETLTKYWDGSTVLGVTYTVHDLVDPGEGTVYWGSTPETTPTDYSNTVSASVAGDILSAIFDFSPIGIAETVFMAFYAGNTTTADAVYLEETFEVPSETQTFTPTITPAIETLAKYWDGATLMSVSYTTHDFIDPDEGTVYWGATPETTPTDYSNTVTASVAGGILSAIFDFSPIGPSETVFMAFYAGNTTTSDAVYAEETFEVPSETPTDTPTVTFSPTITQTNTPQPNSYLVSEQLTFTGVASGPNNYDLTISNYPPSGFTSVILKDHTGNVFYGAYIPYVDSASLVSATASGMSIAYTFVAPSTVRLRDAFSGYIIAGKPYRLLVSYSYTNR